MRRSEALAWQGTIAFGSLKEEGEELCSADCNYSKGVVTMETQPLKVTKGPRMEQRWTNTGIFNWLSSCPLPMFSIGQTHQKSRSNSASVVHMGQLSGASNRAWMGEERVRGNQPNKHILVMWPGSYSWWAWKLGLSSCSEKLSARAFP